MKKTIVIFALILCLMSTVLLTACGETPPTDTEEKTLYVDMQSLMPTANTSPTPDNPNVVNATRSIATAFKAATGIEIVWATDAANNSQLSNVASYYTNAIKKKKVPAIGFTWGTKLQDRGFYLDLTPYLEEANEFVTGNTKWKDMFKDYLWSSNEIVDAKGRIVAVPITLYPGNATGIFYNKDIFSDNAKSIPTSYSEFDSIISSLKNVSGVTQPYTPWGTFTGAGFDQWVSEFTITPNYLNTLIRQTQNSPDYNGDGSISTAEELRGVLNNLYTTDGPNAALVKQMLNVVYDYYKNILPSGWASSASTFGNEWNAGSVAMSQNGLWNIRTENARLISRDWEYGLFPMPLVDNTFSKTVGSALYSASNASATTFGTLEEVNSSVHVSLNIITEGAKTEETVKNAIKFLKFLTVPENNINISKEQIAMSPLKGITSGDDINPILQSLGWMDNEFYITPNAKWPFGYTTLNIGNLNTAFQAWIAASNKSSADNTFFNAYNTNIKAGAEAMIAALNIDTTSWL